MHRRSLVMFATGCELVFPWTTRTRRRVMVSVAVDGTFVYVLTSPGGTNRILEVAR